MPCPKPMEDRSSEWGRNDHRLKTVLLTPPPPIQSRQIMALSKLTARLPVKVAQQSPFSAPNKWGKRMSWQGFFPSVWVSSAEAALLKEEKDSIFFYVSSSRLQGGWFVCSLCPLASETCSACWTQFLTPHPTWSGVKEQDQINMLGLLPCISINKFTPLVHSEAYSLAICLFCQTILGAKWSFCDVCGLPE